MIKRILNLSKIYFTQDSINYNFSDVWKHKKRSYIYRGDNRKNPLYVYKIKNKYYEKDIAIIEDFVFSKSTNYI
jgi:hypothetical protein